MRVPITQAEANELWENPEVDLAQWYANALKTFTIGFVFAPLFPLALPITFVAMIIQYISSKYLFLRRHSLSKKFGSGLSVDVLWVMNFMIILYYAANLYY